MEHIKLTENIDKLASAKGTSRSQALIDSGVGKDFISDMKRKNTSPSIKKLQMLADYFNVSTDYLLGNEQKEKSLSVKDKLIAEIVDTLTDKSEDELIALRDMLIKFVQSKRK